MLCTIAMKYYKLTNNLSIFINKSDLRSQELWVHNVGEPCSRGN